MNSTFGDVELHVVGEAGEEIGAECARGATEDLALSCAELGVLELHHVGGSEIGGEHDGEIGEVQGFAAGEGDACGVEDA